MSRTATKGNKMAAAWVSVRSATAVEHFFICLLKTNQSTAMWRSGEVPALRAACLHFGSGAFAAVQFFKFWS